MPFSRMRSRTSPSMSSAMRVKFSSVSLLKQIISSTRFMNSGRRKSPSAFMARSRSLSVALPTKPREPLLVLLPALVVMMMTVFSKLTVRPWASVMRPSSRICSRMFMTSGWAFSISSKSTTE